MNKPHYLTKNKTTYTLTQHGSYININSDGMEAQKNACSFKELTKAGFTASTFIPKK